MLILLYNDEKGGMNMYRFAIIDDQEISKDIILKHIQQYFFIKKISIKETYYQDPLTFDFDVNYDAIFLDIDMPTQDGITFARELKKKNNTPIIFMTNHSQYVFSTLDVQPFHFIQKENIDVQAPNVLELLFNKLKKENIFININDKGIQKRINYIDIYYISIDDHICEVYTQDNCYQTWDTLSSLYENLHLYDFIKINRSTLVNLKHISRIEKNNIILNNNTVLSVSIRLKPTVIKHYQSYIIRSI